MNGDGRQSVNGSLMGTARNGTVTVTCENQKIYCKKYISNGNVYGKGNGHVYGKGNGNGNGEGNGNGNGTVTPL